MRVEILVKTVIAVGLSGIVAAKGLAQEKPAAASPAVVLKVKTFSDPQTNGIESHTVLVPDGWKAEGGAWWPGQAYFRILPSQDIKVIAPDGRMVHIGPSLSAVDFRPSAYAAQQLGVPRPAEGAADGGNIVLYMPNNPAEWKEFLLRKAFLASFPKAQKMRIDKVSVIPELTAVLQKQLEPIRQQQAQSDAIAVGMRSGCDGAVMTATCFYELDGKKWEHMIAFGTTRVSLESQMGLQHWWGIEPSVSYRAPAGELAANMPLMMAIANSARPTPQWAQMKADHNAKMNQIAAKGAADRAAIIAKSNRDINKIINDGYQSRQASQDRQHEQFIKYIRGVEDYTTPGSSTSVQLPNNYERVLTNGSGDYILTNDSNYDPNLDPLINNKRWDAMEQAK